MYFYGEIVVPHVVVNRGHENSGVNILHENNSPPPLKKSFFPCSRAKLEAFWFPKRGAQWTLGGNRKKKFFLINPFSSIGQII